MPSKNKDGSYIRLGHVVKPLFYNYFSSLKCVLERNGVSHDFIGINTQELADLKRIKAAILIFIVSEPQMLNISWPTRTSVLSFLKSFLLKLLEKVIA